MAICAIPEIPQGSEAKFTITVKDKQGDPIDLTTLDHGYVVWVYSLPANVVAKFSSAPVVTGHTLVTVIDAPNGKFQIKITRGLTATLAENTYCYELKTEITDGITTFMPAKTAKPLFKIIPGQSKTLLAIS